MKEGRTGNPVLLTYINTMCVGGLCAFGEHTLNAHRV